MPHGSKKWCNNGVIQHIRMAGQQLGSARRIGFIASKYLWRSDRVHMTAMASRTAAFSDGCHAGRSWYPWYRKHQAWRTFKHKMKIFEHVQHMFSTTIHVGSCWILLENLGICWGRANSWHLNPKLCGLSESSKLAFGVWGVTTLLGKTRFLRYVYIDSHWDLRCVSAAFRPDEFDLNSSSRSRAIRHSQLQHAKTILNRPGLGLMILVGNNISKR